MVSWTARFLSNAFKGVFGGEPVPSAKKPGATRRSPLRRKALLEGLEHRLLLSADPAGALAADPTETTEPAVSAPLAGWSEADTAAPPIVMALADGLSHAEIARATGLAVGTVKSHIRRALLRLRSSLASPADTAA